MGGGENSLARCGTGGCFRGRFGKKNYGRQGWHGVLTMGLCRFQSYSRHRAEPHLGHQLAGGQCVGGPQPLPELLGPGTGQWAQEGCLRPIWCLLALGGAPSCGEQGSGKGQVQGPGLWWEWSPCSPQQPVNKASFGLPPTGCGGFAEEPGPTGGVKCLIRAGSGLPSP